MFLKNRNNISKIKRSKVTDYATLNIRYFLGSYFKILYIFCMISQSLGFKISSISQGESNKNHQHNCYYGA